MSVTRMTFVVAAGVNVFEVPSVYERIVLVGATKRSVRCAAASAAATIDLPAAVIAASAQVSMAVV